MAEGVSSDEFRSFPSGHTACAACAMLIGLLPTLRKGKEKRTRLLFILGCLWAAAVAVSRIWMGAHFLTDVTMAWLIALGMCALCVHLFYFLTSASLQSSGVFFPQAPIPSCRRSAPSSLPTLSRRTDAEKLILMSFKKVDNLSLLMYNEHGDEK